MPTERYQLVRWLAMLAVVPVVHLSFFGVPTIGIPGICSAPAVILLIFVPPLIALLPPGLFWLWTRRDSGRVRTACVAIVVAALSIWHFLVSWDYGLQYQGYSHTRTTALLSFGFGLAIAISLVLPRKSPYPLLAARWLTIIWIFGSAFPYLGEWP